MEPRFEWINYHHLLYFWTAAKEGSIARASRRLLLAQPTISGQIRQLEESLGDKLFRKSGRNLELTDFGRMVYRYAEDIFSMGRELLDVVKGRPQSGRLRLMVGIADVVPKILAHRILEPAMKLGQDVHIVCHEDKPEQLLSELENRDLDLLLTDAPLRQDTGRRAFNHLLGTCGTSFLATPALAARYRKGFPDSLNGAPFLLPLPGTMQRAALDQWFETRQIQPKIAGEFQDNALMQVFAAHGAGVFAVSSVIEKEVKEEIKGATVGRESSIVERFYAVSIERKFKHPAVAAICETARNKMFASDVA